jgi:hypothetical protein
MTLLIDKLTEIQRSIGVEGNPTILKQAIEAQDCALQIQAEIAEMLRLESIQDAVRIVPDVFPGRPSALSGWRHAFAALLPLAGLSPLWRR